MRPYWLWAASAVLCCCLVAPWAYAQEEAPIAPEGAAADAAAPVADEAPQPLAEGIMEQIDKNAQAQEYSAGVLQPIYAAAEYLAFPAVHWVAFALMATGVVSFALQLVLGKLVVLSRMGLSFKEILSDALGLLISVVGLVLTTQAAVENSTFTQSPASVLSATALGVVLGFVFYLWGQSQEIEAARGRSAAAQAAAQKPE